jgi:hypothetical protein
VSVSRNNSHRVSIFEARVKSTIGRIAALRTIAPEMVLHPNPPPTLEEGIRHFNLNGFASCLERADDR